MTILNNAAAWWRSYEQWKTSTRGMLDAAEIREFERWNINATMEPERIEEYLKRQRTVIECAIMDKRDGRTDV